MSHVEKLNLIESRNDFVEYLDNLFFQNEEEYRAFLNDLNDKEYNNGEKFSDRSLDYLMFVHDSDIHQFLAKQGRPQDLDILVHNPNWHVRCEVAKQGRPQDLDILMHDANCYVVTEVAKHGFGLDELVNHRDYHVRLAVAQHGRPQDLMILESDIATCIREAVENVRIKQVFTDSEWQTYQTSDGQTKFWEMPKEVQLQYIGYLKRELSFESSKPISNSFYIDSLKNQLVAMGENIDINSSQPFQLPKINFQDTGYAKDFEGFLSVDDLGLAGVDFDSDRFSDVVWFKAYDTSLKENKHDADAYAQNLNFSCEVRYVPASASMGEYSLIAEISAENREDAEQSFEKIVHQLHNGENELFNNLIGLNDEPSLDSEAKDMSAAKDAQDTPAAGHDKDKGAL